MADWSEMFQCFMPCDRRARCGDFHSIKWYKENRRVFVYSPVVDFSKAEGELLERSSLALDTQEARLTIDPILTTDEGEYKCEITFLDISKNCPVVQLVKLTTLAEPKYANISLSRGQAGLPPHSVLLLHTTHNSSLHLTPPPPYTGHTAPRPW